MTDELWIDQAAVDRLLDLPLSTFAKGYPVGMRGTVAGLIGLDARDLPTPAMVLLQSALSHNISTMAAYCQAHGAWLAPHAKTTMAPTILALQVAAGGWGMTASSLGQVAVLRNFGISRIVLANELADPIGLPWLAAELANDPNFEFFCLVDSPAGMDLLRRLPEGRVGVFVELGHADGRTGVRTIPDFVRLADIVKSSNQRLVGVEGYEGLLAGRTGGDSVGAYLAELARVTDALRATAETDVPFLVSAGGSALFDEVVERFENEPGVQLVLRSGCYVTHDAGWYQSVSPFGDRQVEGRSLRNAIEVHATITSRPEPSFGTADAGKRDVGQDLGLPIVLSRVEPSGTRTPISPNPEVKALSDQHTHLTSAAGVEIGDRIALGVSHPCSTFDRWRVIPILDESDVVTDVAVTFF